MSHPYQSSGGERGQVDRQQHQQRQQLKIHKGAAGWQQLKIHKGAAGWQQLQSAAAAAAEGSTSATVGVRKPQVPNNSTATFSNSSSLQQQQLHHQHPLQLPPATSIPPTLPRPAHLPSSSSSSSSSSSTVVRGGSKGGNEFAAAPARSGSHVEHEPAFFKMQRPTTSSQQQQQQGLVAGRGELPTERLEHTQQHAGGPHHQQSADLEKPASMGGVTRSSALSFGHGGLSATGQQAATTPEVFQRPLSQNPSSFQFGSFNPGSGGGMKHRPTVMKIPKRTSSAPPDFDELIPQQRRAWGMGGSMERPNLVPDHQRMQASMQEPATSLAAALAEPPPVQQQHQAHHPHQQGILQQSSSQTMKAFNKSTMPLQTHHHAPPPILHASHSLTGKPSPPGLSGSSQYGHPPPLPPSIDQVVQPHPSKATHHLVHLGTEEEFWSHTKVKSGLESFHAESGDLQNHPAPALPLARVNPSHKPPPQYRVPGGLLGGVPHQHQTASSSVNRYPSRQAEEHEHVVTHKFSSLDLTKTEVVPGPAESALIPAAAVVSSQLGVDQIHPCNPLPSGIQDSTDIDNPTPAAIAAAAPTLEEVSVVHQTGQEEGPPVLGGSCTSDPEGLVNGQVVGGFDNTLSKSDCKPDPGHQVRVSGEESPPLSSTLENVEDFLVSTTASETTTAVEGDGFEGVGLVNNPVCCAAEQVAVRGNKTSEVLEESSIQSNHQQTVEGQEDMQGSSSVMDTAVDGPLLPGSRAHKVADDAGDTEENSACACSTVVVEDPFIEQGPGLQSSAEIAAGVESEDGCIPGINSSISSSRLVLGKIDASSEAQSLKVLVARDVSFQAGSQLKDESSNQMQRESLEKADASIDTTMCVEESADDKALKDTTLEEVQRTELPVHNPAVSGGDINREPPLPSAILGMTHEEHTEDWEVVAELPTPKSALLETLGSEANLDPSQTCREYSRDFLLVYRDQYHDLPGDFAIRQDVAELFSHPLGAGGSSGESSVDISLSTPGQSLELQPPSLATPVVDWRVGNSPGPLEEDGHTRAAGILSTSSSSSGHGYFGGDMIMAASEFRPPHGHFLPGLIPHLPLRPPPGLSHLTDHWQQHTPSEIRGLIPPPLPLPQHTAAPTIHKAKAPYEVGKVSDMEQIKQRQIKGILNKLTPQNFEKLFAQVKDVNIDSALTLMGVISQIFDKALTEPTFCEMYATFCAELAIVLPEFVEDDEKITFRRVLLNKCQEEFERGEREQEEAEKVEPEGETQLDPKEREEKRSSARRRMLGNIRFIGELYKKSMLTERIMHECIKKLLGEYQHPDEEDVEALCKLMRTIGHIIDHPKARDHIDAYFRRMESLSVNMELPSRIRFMLKDMIDLRRDGWQERRKVEGPKKIDEVHRDAVQERQQAMANTGGRDRFSRGSIIGGLGRGRIVPGSDFGMRGGPPAPLFPPNPRMAAGPAMGFMQGPPLQQGGGARGGPVFGQELHMEESRRFLVDSHSLPTQLSQRSTGEGPITLGPQGGLGRGIVMRGLPPGAVGRSTLADMAPPPPMMMMGGDIRRAGGMGIPSGYGGGPNRTPFGARDHHLYGRPPGADRQLGSYERPLLERSSVIDRHGPVVSGLRHTGSERTSGNNESPMVMPMPPAATLQSHRPVTTPFVSVAANSSSVAQTPSDQDLRRKANSAIAEYYRVHDLKEATLCVEELKFPQFYPAMVSMWVSDSLDKRDAERDLLFKLLAHLHNSEPCVLTHDQITKGFESVLSMLEDTIVDVPQAPDLLARMLGKLITAGVFSLAQVGKLLRESGPKPPHSLLETGNALIVFGSLLDTLRKQKGEDAMVHMFKDSGLQVEDFCSPVDKQKGATLDRFLEKSNLQCLHPMKPVEKHIGEALGRDEPASEIVQWIQKNVQQPIIAGPEFLRMLMTQVLRRCVPHHDNNLVLNEIKIYAPLLRHFASGKGRAAVENQRQYIVAVQLYANGLDHPQGLMRRLFDCFYHEEVISEAAYMKWQDDVHDSTPGRDKAIREVFTWLRWLATAPEEEGDEDD